MKLQSGSQPGLQTSESLTGAGGCSSKVTDSHDCQLGIGSWWGWGLLSSADRLLHRLHECLHDMVADFQWSE